MPINKQLAYKVYIRFIPYKRIRIKHWFVYYITYPFVWLWYNIRDWRTFVIFVIVFLVMSSEVWVPYLISIITWGTSLSKWMLGVASACWLFWLGPFTPFIPLCVTITIFIKEIFNHVKIKRKK